MSPFTFINAINDHTDVPLTKDYNQFLVNRNFSMFRDTVLIANMANQYKGQPDDIHYMFYKSAITKRKRFAKWPKKDVDLINIVAEYFDFSNEKAIEAINILTEAQQEAIKEWYERKL